MSSLPKLKSLDLSSLDMDDEFAHERVQSVSVFASLTELVPPVTPKINDWEIVAEALSASKTLEKVTFTLLGERGDGWARALGARLRADAPLSSVNLTKSRMTDTALQALESLLLTKSLYSVSVVMERNMSHYLAVSQELLQAKLLSSP